MLSKITSSACTWRSSKFTKIFCACRDPRNVAPPWVNSKSFTLACALPPAESPGAAVWTLFKVIWPRADRSPFWYCASKSRISISPLKLCSWLVTSKSFMKASPWTDVLSWAWLIFKLISLMIPLSKCTSGILIKDKYETVSIFLR